MKVFYFTVITSLALYANSPHINSTDFLEGCVTKYQIDEDVKLVKSWYKNMVDVNSCNKAQFEQLLNNKVYVKNAILMLKFKMETKECKEALNGLNSNFNVLASYLKVNNKPNNSCNDNIPNYWTHLLNNNVNSYKSASISSKILESIKRGMILKIIAYDKTQEWGEFKYESNGQSVTGWIKLSEVEKINK